MAASSAIHLKNSVRLQVQSPSISKVLSTFIHISSASFATYPLTAC